ncbi:hypothetical protein C8Q75DRAFT_863574 [Abortiporus biennis]|nr:hypothetical protein C8Q75DRAFT_863574 [Abortiporus biennis]
MLALISDGTMLFVVDNLLLHASEKRLSQIIVRECIIAYWKHRKGVHFTSLTTYGYSSCLLTEYEGEDWIDPNYSFELDTKVQKEILEVLGKMHNAGLTQSTFEFDLYQLPNGRIVVIDIEDLHEEPDFKEIPCNELHRVAKLLIFWKSRVLYYHNKPFDASYAINTDVYGLADRALLTVSRKSAIQDACKIILNYLRANFKDIYNCKHKDL